MMNPALIAGLLGQLKQQGTPLAAQATSPALNPAQQPIQGGLMGVASSMRDMQRFLPQAKAMMLEQQQNQQPANPPMQGLGSQSKGLFDAYMGQIFDQKYRPSTPLGGYQDFGAYGGFMPTMTPRQMIDKKTAAAPQQPVMGGQSSNGYTGGFDQYGMPLNWHEWLNLQGGMGS
jgi:hypothetical protein